MNLKANLLKKLPHNSTNKGASDLMTMLIQKQLDKKQANHTSVHWGHATGWLKNPTSSPCFSILWQYCQLFPLACLILDSTKHLKALCCIHAALFDAEFWYCSYQGRAMTLGRFLNTTFYFNIFAIWCFLPTKIVFPASQKLWFEKYHTIAT